MSIGYGILPDEIPFNLDPKNEASGNVTVTASAKKKEDNTLLYMGLAALIIIVAATSNKK